MKQPIRILQVLASLDRGGAETMIMNIYRNLDKNKVQFDFIVNENQKDYAYESEIRKLGGKIFYIPRYKTYNYLSYKRIWKKLLGEHPEWNIIHGHHTSTAFIYLKVAKNLNRLTIAHSHTAGSRLGIKSIIKIVMRCPLRYMADYLFACSDSAAKWMFGKYNTSTYILNNAIDVQKYIFSERERQIKRKEFNIQDEFVIGHIGNFSEVKNYQFILRVFESILKYKNDTILILVGKNENNIEIERKVKEMGLENQVIFTGVRSDIPELLQTIDVFLFPSFYEGLPVTLVEAQASGLKCIISNTITDEVKITDGVEFIDLDDSLKYWTEEILKYADGYERKNTYDQICKAGYDVKENVKYLEDFYLKENKKILSKQ